MIRHAAALSVALTIAGGASAQSIGRLVGKWNHDRSGENVVVAPDSLGGYQFWSSEFGQGRISSTSYEGANIKVEARGVACFYLATLTAGAKMNWQLRAGEPGCISRVFTRAE